MTRNINSRYDSLKLSKHWREYNSFIKGDGHGGSTVPEKLLKVKIRTSSSNVFETQGRNFKKSLTSVKDFHLKRRFKIENPMDSYEFVGQVYENARKISNHVVDLDINLLKIMKPLFKFSITSLLKTEHINKKREFKAITLILGYEHLVHSPFEEGWKKPSRP